MKVNSFVFKRPDREKKTNRLDANGNPKITKLKGGWFYRISYVDVAGKPATLERGPFSLKSSAKDARDAKVRDLEKSLGNIRSGERMTFDQLADICEEELYKPAVMSGSKKVAGVKSHVSAKAIIGNLREFFGKSRINGLTAQSLQKYREHRVKQSVKSAKTESAKRH